MNEGKNLLKDSISFKNFWYIVCSSQQLKKNQALPRKILNEWLVVFRDENGRPVIMQDRCIHRNSQLSKGQVQNGQLQCSYHGWTFNGQGKLVCIPSEGPNQQKIGNRCAKTYECLEQDDFIFVRLGKHDTFHIPPYRMPHYQERGWETIRLFNVFQNNVLNCAENYVDVPHTVFVHDKIFRSSSNEKVTTNVQRKNGAVHIEYLGETDNLGWFSWFLNPSKKPIVHIDHYYMPNFTSVQYAFGRKEFWISSQSIPVEDNLTYVWTDLTYKFGLLNKIARPIVRYQGQSVIDQDIVALNNQMKVIKKYGMNFSNSTADIVHVFIESIYNEIAEGRDPRHLSEKKNKVEFWV